MLAGAAGGVDRPPLSLGPMNLGAAFFLAAVMVAIVAALAIGVVVWIVAHHLLQPAPRTHHGPSSWDALL
jgi:hypothetical protein